MSADFNWTGAEECEINIAPKDFDPSEWTINVCDEDPEGIHFAGCGCWFEGITSGPSLILGSDSALVIEADSYEQLAELGRTIASMCERAAATQKATVA